VVEHQLPKLRVEGSNPFSRSNKNSHASGFLLASTTIGLASRQRANHLKTDFKYFLLQISFEFSNFGQ
jgi:hypothetical protein